MSTLLGFGSQKHDESKGGRLEMPILQYQKDFQAVRRLPFCYLCGNDFSDGDVTDGDHVPPKAVFKKEDRGPVLKLKSHKKCNAAWSSDDKRVGQLIGLRRRESPSSARDHALKFGHYPGLGVAVENLNVEGAVWRWIKGFHAALYRQPLIGDTYSIQTPFPRADRHRGHFEVRPIRQQDLLAVQTIKTNRASRNLDAVASHNNTLRYESVWCQADDELQWFCTFALDIYDWKDLGSHSQAIPARGCVGVYALPDRSVPSDAARDEDTRIIIPNVDPFDPFAP